MLAPVGGGNLVAERGEFHPFKSREARDHYLAFYDDRAGRWPVPSETRTVRTPQGETFVRMSGPEGAPPLVLLNGIMSASVMWPAEMITAFADRYRVHTVDNPWDFGRSVNARDTTSRDDYTAWLGGVLDGLGLERVNILGISLGSWIAAEYALVRPERVAKMVLMSPGGVIGFKLTPPVIRNMPRMMRAMRSPSVDRVREMLHGMMPDSKGLEGAEAQEDEEYTESVALGMQCFVKRPLTMATNRRFKDAELRDLPMPVLYLAGETEVFVPPRKAVARLRRAAPAIRAVVVPDCGHDLITLKPEVAARHVLEFLDG